MERVLTASVPLPPTRELRTGAVLFFRPMNTIKKICGIGAICGYFFASSLLAVTPTPTPTATPTPYPSTLVDQQKQPSRYLAFVIAPGLNVPAFILVDEHGNPVSLGGGGSGGLTNTELRASAVPVSGPLTDTQLRATPVPVAQTGAQYTIAITVATTGATIAAGKHHIEFILSPDFAGTIGGAAISGSLGIYDPGPLPVGSTFAALVYTISAGNATITTW